MSEAEAKAAIAEVIKATGAKNVKDIGKVMATLKQSYAGKMDFGKVSGLVKGLLAGSAHQGGEGRSRRPDAEATD